MKRTQVSAWDVLPISHELANEVVKLDKAHKRAKRELSKQQNALANKNYLLKCYKEMHDDLMKRYNLVNRRLRYFQDKALEDHEQKIKQLSDISAIEIKITCLEQENKMLRKEQTNKEKEVQERIIQSMSDTIVELRAQLNETEEKYNKLLKKYIFYQK